MNNYNARVLEQGNGFPNVGDYAPGTDGELYRITRMSRIHTGNSSGASNYVYAVVELADWGDCEEGDESTCQVAFTGLEGVR